MARFISCSLVLALVLVVGSDAGAAGPRGRGGRAAPGHPGSHVRPVGATVRVGTAVGQRRFVVHPRYGYGYYLGSRYYRVYFRYVPDVGYQEVVEVVEEPDFVIIP
jgi:hypothetical protein